MAFILKKNDDKKELFSTNLDFEGYKFNSRKSKTIIKVNNVTVIDPKMINDILTIKFNQKFNKILAMSKYVLNDEDASDSDVAMVIDEVQLVKSILQNRYQKFLNQKKEELFLKKLRLIENELRVKQVLIASKSIYLNEEMAKKSR